MCPTRDTGHSCVPRHSAQRTHRHTPNSPCCPAVMDILARVDHEFLSTVCSEPGGCIQVTPTEMADLLQRTANKSTLKRYALPPLPFLFCTFAAASCARHPRRPCSLWTAHMPSQEAQTLTAQTQCVGPQPLSVVCCLLHRIPGGSAANVMKGLANVSRRKLKCNFMGMVAVDATGAQYRCATHTHTHTHGHAALCTCVMSHRCRTPVS